VWARVGIEESAPAATSKQKDLETKLMQAISDLSNETTADSDGGLIPPQKPPRNTKAADNEGPGDGMREEFVVSRLNRTALAVYANSKDEIVRVGKLSG
jgi:hypothetical protein